MPHFRITHSPHYNAKTAFSKFSVSRLDILHDHNSATSQVNRWDLYYYIEFMDKQFCENAPYIQLVDQKPFFNLVLKMNVFWETPHREERIFSTAPHHPPPDQKDPDIFSSRGALTLCPHQAALTGPWRKRCGRLFFTLNLLWQQRKADISTWDEGYDVVLSGHR